MEIFTLPEGTIAKIKNNGWVTIDRKVPLGFYSNSEPDRQFYWFEVDEKATMKQLCSEITFFSSASLDTE